MSKICQDTASGHLSKGGRVKLILREISETTQDTQAGKGHVPARHVSKGAEEKHDKLNPWRST